MFASIVGVSALGSHALQQQHDGVELLPGSVVGPQRHDEVVQAVPRALRRNNDQFVPEAVRAGILERDVVTGLRGETVVMAGARREVGTLKER